MGNAPAQPDVSNSLQEILNKAHQGPLYTYPTSLTQGDCACKLCIRLVKLYMS
jgi:hypothetical protein